MFKKVCCSVQGGSDCCHKPVKREDEEDAVDGWLREELEYKRLELVPGRRQRQEQVQRRGQVEQERRRY